VRGHSVDECRGGKRFCTSVVQHERLADVAEPVNFVISTLESDLQLILVNLGVLDVAGR